MPAAPRLSLLVDTRSRVPGLRTEPGFSLLVETGTQTLLLDTGTSGAFLGNLLELGRMPECLDHLLLSHGHMDHAGGLPEALAAWPEVEVLLHPTAKVPRWSLYKDHPPRALGFPARSQKALAAHRGAVRSVGDRLELAPGLELLGPAPCRHPEELRSGPFFMDPEGREPDPFADELTLCLDTPEGLVLVLGCCHGGVLNTLEHALEQTGAARIRAVVGGLHLAKAGKGRLAFTAEGLLRLGSPELHLCHCTGAEACEVLPNVVQILQAGNVVTFA